MQENFLHYVWKFQKFETSNLKTVLGEFISVKAVGYHNTDSGPDFFNAQITIDNQLWAGNIEIHIKSSDWYAHQHEKDVNYDNVILHVVWKHDAEIFRNDNSRIPTLVLNQLITPTTLSKYRELFSKKHKWINCEKDFADVDQFLLNNWLERLFVERLEQKTNLIMNELRSSNNHWEDLLFKLLCKNFGMIVNKESFFSVARSIDLYTVKKCSHRQLDLESLLMGQAGLLLEEKEDGYYQDLQKNYWYLRKKFNLESDGVIAPKFFRLRPPNFPTVRMSQLASLYFHKKKLFSELIQDIPWDEPPKTIDTIYNIFDISASEYWDNHYNFGVTSVKRKKKLSKSFIDTLVINTVIPIQFCFAKQKGSDATEALIQLASIISCEKNMIVKKFNELRPLAWNSLESQALLQLKNNYCSKMRCLECAIGNRILKE